MYKSSEGSSTDHLNRSIFGGCFSSEKTIKHLEMMVKVAASAVEEDLEREFMKRPHERKMRQQAALLNIAWIQELQISYSRQSGETEAGNAMATLLSLDFLKQKQDRIQDFFLQPICFLIEEHKIVRRRCPRMEERRLLNFRSRRWQGFHPNEWKKLPLSKEEWDS